MGKTKFETPIFGKDVIVYRPKGNKSYTYKDISQYLRKFKLCDALKLIGEFSYKLFENSRSVLVHKDIPIFDGVLAYITMLLIENSNDYRSGDMTEDDLLTAIDMYFGLSDPYLTDENNPVGFLVRFGTSQYDYDRDMRHLLPRTLILYSRLWNNNEIDIERTIQEVSGLKLTELLVLGYAFTNQASKGFFRLYENVENYSDAVRKYFDSAKQQSFVDWVSSTYTEFRTRTRTHCSASDNYEKFRFNPLWLNPVIIPDRNPKPPFSKPYIAPLPILISRKVTSGLYFTLSDHFRKEPTNNQIFRNSFGYVFQEYIGLIFKKTIGDKNVLPEWKYGTKKSPKDTPDWLIIQDSCALLVEVKQSCLYLESKKSGKTSRIQEDLKKTIGKGVYQLHSFESDIESGACCLPDNIQVVERMVVIYDSSYYLNSLIRDEIKSIYPQISDTYHWHVVTVEDLEYFLGVVGEDLIQALIEKRLNHDTDRMDFRDYLSRKFSDNPRNPYLDSIFRDFFKNLGIEDLNDESLYKH